MTELSILKSSSFLASKKMTVAFIESATAGMLCGKYALTPFSGDLLIGGIVCYDVEVKKKLLDISQTAIDTYTAESKEITHALALNGKKYFEQADIIVAVTGLTKPGGSETEEKPVGSMFVSILYNDKCVDFEHVFSGNSYQIIDKTIEFVSDKLLTIDDL